MDTTPRFVIMVAGAGGYFSNGYPVGPHYSSHADATQAMQAMQARSPKDRFQVEDWTASEELVEAWREAQEEMSPKSEMTKDDFKAIEQGFIDVFGY